MATRATHADLAACRADVPSERQPTEGSVCGARTGLDSALMESYPSLSLDGRRPVSGARATTPGMTSDQSPLTQVESELLRLSGRETVRDALVALALVPKAQPDTVFEIEPHPSGWHRGGAETYELPFCVVPSCGVRMRFRLKACVAVSFTSSLEEILESWLHRRRLLESSGVAVPVLYASGAGEVLEEEVPLSLEEQLACREVSRPFLYGLAHLTATLVRLGFEPLDPFRDLRTRGNDVVVVDFGSDLGPPGTQEPSPDRLLQVLFDQLASWKCRLSAEDQALVRLDVVSAVTNAATLRH